MLFLDAQSRDGGLAVISKHHVDIPQLLKQAHGPADERQIRPPAGGAEADMLRLRRDIVLPCARQVIGLAQLLADLDQLPLPAVILEAAIGQK